MKKTLICTALTSALFLVGCGETSQGQIQPPPQLVVAEPVEYSSHQQSKSYIGRIEAIEDTNITAQVTGYLKARHFQEGQMVEKGQLLYTIEPSSFEAQLASAKATLAQANATLKKQNLISNAPKTYCLKAVFLNLSSIISTLHYLARRRR